MGADIFAVGPGQYSCAATCLVVSGLVRRGESLPQQQLILRFSSCFSSGAVYSGGPDQNRTLPLLLNCNFHSTLYTKSYWWTHQLSLSGRLHCRARITFLQPLSRPLWRSWFVVTICLTDPYTIVFFWGVVSVAALVCGTETDEWSISTRPAAFSIVTVGAEKMHARRRQYRRPPPPTEVPGRCQTSWPGRFLRAVSSGSLVGKFPVFPFPFFW